MINISVDGKSLVVDKSANLAAVLLVQKIPTRADIAGAPRAPFCGMGICGECRVVLNSVRHVLACRVACEDGMKIETRK